MFIIIFLLRKEAFAINKNMSASRCSYLDEVLEYMMMAMEVDVEHVLPWWTVEEQINANNTVELALNDNDDDYDIK